MTRPDFSRRLPSGAGPFSPRWAVRSGKVLDLATQAALAANARDVMARRLATAQSLAGDLAYRFQAGESSQSDALAASSDAATAAAALSSTEAQLASARAALAVAVLGRGLGRSCMAVSRPLMAAQQAHVHGTWRRPPRRLGLRRRWPPSAFSVWPGGTGLPWSSQRCPHLGQAARSRRSRAAGCWALAAFATMTHQITHQRRSRPAGPSTPANTPRASEP